MNADTKAATLECLGIAEGIAMRLRAILDGTVQERRTTDEYRDIARTLAEVENRMYGTGEYAATASPERGNRPAPSVETRR